MGKLRQSARTEGFKRWRNLDKVQGLRGLKDGET